MRGGQVSVEYLVVIGFSMLLIVPLIIFFYAELGSIQSGVRESTAIDTTQLLRNAAQEVYYAGVGSKTTVLATVPGEVSSFEIRNMSVVMTLGINKPYDIVAPSRAPLIPVTLSTNKGKAQFTVESTIGGVLISE